MYHYTVETWKGRGTPFLYQAQGREIMRVTLPKLARGVQRGPVTVELREGLYCYDDRKPGGTRWFMVDLRGTRHDIARDIIGRVRKDVEHFVRFPCDLPSSAMGVDGVRHSGSGVAWIAQVLGVDEKYGLKRAFLSRVGSRIASSFYLERGRMYEVCYVGKPREMVIVESSGELWRVDATEVMRGYREQERERAREAVVASAGVAA